MHITTSKEKNIRIIGIDGKVDSFTSKDFQDSLIRHIIDGEKLILVDCSKLEYISSSGIRAFYFALRELNDHGTIAVCSANENVLHTLEIVDFFSDFPIYSTIDEAIENLS
ncbi:MAG: STAS domain-containing protein [Candidatus Cloacimonetes bacterium]|nr:STAS domain-containing protein [Candidatus Cloacimonadota bacterium]